jgi:hypothetical protein
LAAVSALALVLAALGTALLFFALIPGVGAFGVRWQWRLFRRRMLEASLAPFLRYSDLGGAEGRRGDYRVFGELEAIQGRDRIWINTGQFTVEADLEGVRLYLLPSLSGGGLPEPLPDEEPAVAPWSRVFSLPSGMRLFVGGSLFLEEGRGVFRSSPGAPLLLVFYDGERESILKRAIWGGRKRNEYWNPFTLPSLLTGFLCLALLAYLSLRSSQAGLPGLAVLSLAAAPAAPFLPPGVALYYLYRWFWKMARRLRAERDLLRLPLRYFPEAGGGERTAQLPTGERYLMCREGALEVQGEPETRQCSRHPDAGESWLFGAVEESEGRRTLRRPADPMAELLRIPGEPAALAALCERTARWYELAAAACFATGLGINLFVVLLLLARLLG